MRRKRTWKIAAIILLAVAFTFSLLPLHWIESRFNIDPDAGSGLIELLLIVIPLIGASAIAICLFRPMRGGRLSQESDARSRLRY
jgi:hypothetical protein